jgi:hypothetical protein
MTKERNEIYIELAQAKELFGMLLNKQKNEKLYIVHKEALEHLNEAIDLLTNMESKKNEQRN